MNSELGLPWQGQRSKLERLTTGPNDRSFEYNDKQTIINNLFTNAKNEVRVVDFTHPRYRNQTLFDGSGLCCKKLNTKVLKNKLWSMPPAATRSTKINYNNTFQKSFYAQDRIASSKETFPTDEISQSHTTTIRGSHHNLPSPEKSPPKSKTKTKGNFFEPLPEFPTDKGLGFGFGFGTKASRFSSRDHHLKCHTTTPPYIGPGDYNLQSDTIQSRQTKYFQKVTRLKTRNKYVKNFHSYDLNNNTTGSLPKPPPTPQDIVIENSQMSKNFPLMPNPKSLWEKSDCSSKN
jgi:hypothetical protein